jgi:hypothetical protein
MAADVKKELLELIESLPVAEQLRLLQSVRRSSSRLPIGTPVEEMDRFVGAWGDEAGREIAQIIEEECERIPAE